METNSVKTKIVNKKTTDKFDVYIGRPSKWGNPFIIGKDGTCDTVIEKYRKWILTQPQLINCLAEVRGKTLACWCKPDKCHGDVLIELADANMSNTLKTKELNILHLNQERDSIEFEQYQRKLNEEKIISREVEKTRQIKEKEKEMMEKEMKKKKEKEKKENKQKEGKNTEIKEKKEKKQNVNFKPLGKMYNEKVATYNSNTGIYRIIEPEVQVIHVTGRLKNRR